MFRLRKTSVAALVILALGMGALLVFGPRRAFLGVTLEPTPAPDFALSAPYRGPVTLADFQGDAVLLTFGRPSCGPPCNPGLAALKAAVDRLGDRRNDVRVLYVNLEPDSLNEQGLLAFVQDHDLGFTGLQGDPSGTAEIAAAYRSVAETVPDSVLAAAATLGGSDATAVTGAGARPGAAPVPRIYGIDRHGVLRVAWGVGEPAAMARDIRTLLRF